MGRSLAIAIVVLLVAFQSAFAQQGDRRMSPVPTLSVTGNGQVSMDPDLAVVRLGATAQAEEASAAQTQVNATMQSVLDAVKDIVARDQIQTSGLSLYPVYSTQQGRRTEQPDEPRITGYRADMTVTVRVRELDKVGDVVDAGLKAGANRLEGISFELENDTRAKAQALQQAVRAAQAKARALASALNVEVVGVIDAIEGGADVVRPMYDMQEFAAARSVAMPSTPIETGQVQVSANVTLRYRIEGTGLPRNEAVEPELPQRPRRDRISEPPPPGRPQPR